MKRRDQHIDSNHHVSTIKCLQDHAKFISSNIEIFEVELKLVKNVSKPYLNNFFFFFDRTNETEKCRRILHG